MVVWKRKKKCSGGNVHPYIYKVPQLHSDILANSAILQEYQIQADWGDTDNSAATFTTQAPGALFYLLGIIITWRWTSHSTFQSFKVSALVAWNSQKDSWFLDNPHCYQGDRLVKHQTQAQYMPRCLVTGTTGYWKTSLFFLFFIASQEKP